MKRPPTQASRRPEGSSPRIATNRVAAAGEVMAGEAVVAAGEEVEEVVVEAMAYRFSIQRVSRQLKERYTTAQAIPQLCTFTKLAATHCGARKIYPLREVDVGLLRLSNRCLGAHSKRGLPRPLVS